MIESVNRLIVEPENKVETIPVYIKRISGTTFTKRHEADSVIGFYENYDIPSIAGQVEPLPGGDKPVPDSLKKAQEYLIFGELKQGQRANKQNFVASHALFFDIEPPKPKEGEGFEGLEYSDINDVTSRKLDGLQYVLHNTINSQEHFARFRLVVPTNRPVTEEEYHIVWDFIADELSALPLDKSSREWYRIQGAPIFNGLGTDVFDINDVGTLVDVDYFLEKLKEYKSPKKVVILPCKYILDVHY